VKGTSLSENLSVYFNQENDYSQFATDVNSITKEQANAGYLLTMTYKPTAIGSHKGFVSIYDGGILGSVKVSLTGVSIPIDSLKCPEPLAASDITDSSFTANWKYASYADNYCLRLYFRNTNSRVLIKEMDSIPENSAEISGLDPGKDYSYTIKTRIGSLLSQESAEMPVSLLSGIIFSSTEKDLRIYTAPGKIYVQASAAGKMLEIFNLSGQKVRMAGTTGYIQEFSGLSNGTYILKCEGKAFKILLF
jgi:hypothetical protein